MILPNPLRRRNRHPVSRVLSLRWKFFLHFLLAVILIVAALNLVTIWSVRRIMFAQQREKLAHLSNLAASAIMPSLTSGDFEDAKARLRGIIGGDIKKDIAFVSIYDGGRRRLLTIVNPKSCCPKESFVRIESRKDPRFVTVSQPIVKGNLFLGTVEMYSCRARLDRRIAGTSWAMTIILGSLLLASLPWTGLFVSRQVIQPISQFAKHARRISQGKLDERLHIQSRDELGSFAKVFNEMATQLDEREAAIKQASLHLQESYQELTAAHDKLRQYDIAKSVFASTAAHELRTPLSTIKAYVETLRKGRFGKLTKAQAEALAVAERSVDRLGRIVNDLSEVARFEREGIALVKAETDLSSILKQAVQEFQPQVVQKDIRLSGSIPRGLNILADGERLRQVIDNLIGNAVKFTPPGGHISLSAEMVNGEVRINFEDTGLGIPEKALHKLFTPFYHDSDNPAAGRQGLGLGLFVSKVIVEAHGGTIGVSSVSGKGSKFTVTIPANLG